MGYNCATVRWWGRGEHQDSERKKLQLSNEKARKRPLGAREHKQSPQEYRDREDSTRCISIDNKEVSIFSPK